MSLYGALREVLIGLGPLPALHLFRLPDEQVNDVITVNEGGVADLVQPGITGMLVPARDPEALAEATLEALSDPSRLRDMGRAGRSFAKARTWPMVIDGLLREYAEVVGASMTDGRSGFYS